MYSVAREISGPRQYFIIKYLTVCIAVKYACSVLRACENLCVASRGLLRDFIIPDTNLTRCELHRQHTTPDASSNSYESETALVFEAGALI
eukprot:scaffold36344_cov66-Phaeocystis_antarctica.AAC.2